MERKISICLACTVAREQCIICSIQQQQADRKRKIHASPNLCCFSACAPPPATNMEREGATRGVAGGGGSTRVRRPARGRRGGRQEEQPAGNLDPRPPAGEVRFASAGGEARFPVEVRFASANHRFPPPPGAGPPPQGLPELGGGSPHHACACRAWGG